MLSGAPQRLYESVKKEFFPLSVVLSKRTLKMLDNKGVFVDVQEFAIISLTFGFYLRLILFV